MRVVPRATDLRARKGTATRLDYQCKKAGAGDRSEIGWGPRNSRNLSPGAAPCGFQGAVFPCGTGIPACALRLLERHPTNELEASLLRSTEAILSSLPS
jgi:hypothetical protein